MITNLTDLEAFLEKEHQTISQSSNDLEKLVVDTRAVADELAGAPGVPLDPLVEALEKLRDLSKRMTTVKDILQAQGASIDDFDFELIKASAVSTDAGTAIEKKDVLVEIIRERMVERERLAAIKEEEGGEELYVEVSRMMAAELENILREANELPGQT